MKLQELIDLAEEHRLVKVFCGKEYIRKVSKELNEIDLQQFIEIYSRNWFIGEVSKIPFSSVSTIFKTHFSKLEIIFDPDFDSPYHFPELNMTTGSTLRSSYPMVWIMNSGKFIDTFNTTK